MAQSNEGKWSFLRLRPFTFDEPKDQLATGSEIAKTLGAYRKFGRDMGRLTVGYLQQAAR